MQQPLTKGSQGVPHGALRDRAAIGHRRGHLQAQPGSVVYHLSPPRQRL